MPSSEPNSPPSEPEPETSPVDECCRPDFIYGGPFIKVAQVEPFLNTSTPINVQLQGTFKKSYAYFSQKERLPVILTRVIDYFSRGKAKSAGASSDDESSFIRFVAQLKNDLVTNKAYEPFTIDTEEGKKWNEWIANQANQHYFTNIWVFTECYVYRKLWEGCELRTSLGNVDYFSELKDEAFDTNLETMCIVADRVVKMLPESAKDQRKADFITLLKLALWSNKCDLCLSVGKQVTLAGEVTGDTQAVFDPFQMITDCKDKLLVDDSGKAADAVVNKADAIRRAIEGGEAPPEPAEGEEAPEPPKVPPEPPKVPCPAKMTIPQTAMFDIVCDNAGYELFTDLCLAHFLISQKIVQKVRFHVKKMPWFVSDATPRDFSYVISACMNANYSRTIEPEPKPVPAEGEVPAGEEPRQITADRLRELGTRWQQFLDDGTFVLMAEDYWTYPHAYKDMKKYDYNLYRKLQYAVAILFKGDLNYRKLLAEKNWVPTTGFEASLQGFIPAPIIACRTVKSELISGLPKGKFEQITKIDEKWREKGDYGVIQYCPKAEALKVSDRPCIDYGKTCFSKTCPVHTDM